MVFLIQFYAPDEQGKGRVRLLVKRAGIRFYGGEGKSTGGIFPFLVIFQAQGDGLFPKPGL